MEQALRTYGPKEEERWDKIQSAVPTRTKRECKCFSFNKIKNNLISKKGMLRYKELAAAAKAKKLAMAKAKKLAG